MAPPTQLQNFGNISLPKVSESIEGQPYPDWVIENKLTFSWDLCNSIRQELIEGGKPHDFAPVKARVVQMMQFPSAVPSSVPPKQSESFDTSLPKESRGIGGQPYPDWVIENKLTFSWDLCNSIRQELIESGKPHDFAAVKAGVVQMMHSSSVVPSSVPPKQLQSFGTSLLKESQSIGGNLMRSGWKLR